LLPASGSPVTPKSSTTVPVELRNATTLLAPAPAAAVSVAATCVGSVVIVEVPPDPRSNAAKSLSETAASSIFAASTLVTPVAMSRS
jgi:hypothetical protein